MKRSLHCLQSINIKKKYMDTAHRQWLRTPKEGSRLTIVNYNILAPSLVHKLAYSCDCKFLDWNYRLPIILSELQALCGDIIFIQECDEKNIKDFEEYQHKNSYESRYLKKSSFSNAKENGLLTLWCTKRLRYIEHYDVNFNLNKEQSTTSLRYSVHSKDDIALIVILQVIESGEYIVATNTHMLYCTNNGISKLAQLDLLLLHLSHLKKYRFQIMPTESTPNVSYIISGDFNSSPNSFSYEVLKEGSFNMMHKSYQDWSGQIVCEKNSKQPKSTLLLNALKYKETPSTKYSTEIKPRLFKAQLEIYNLYLTDTFFEVTQKKATKNEIKVKRKEKVGIIDEWAMFQSFNYIERKKLREVFCRSKAEFKEMQDNDKKGTSDFTTIFSPAYKNPMGCKFNEMYSTFIEQAIKLNSLPNIADYIDYDMSSKEKIEEILKKYTLQPIYNCYPPNCIIKTDFMWASEDCIPVGIYSLPLLKDAKEIPNEKVPSDHHCLACEVILNHNKK